MDQNFDLEFSEISRSGRSRAHDNSAQRKEITASNRPSLAQPGEQQCFLTLQCSKQNSLTFAMARQTSSSGTNSGRHIDAGTGSLVEQKDHNRLHSDAF